MSASISQHSLRAEEDYLDSSRFVFWGLYPPAKNDKIWLALYILSMIPGPSLATAATKYFLAGGFFMTNGDADQAKWTAFRATIEAVGLGVCCIPFDIKLYEHRKNR